MTIPETRKRRFVSEEDRQNLVWFWTTYLREKVRWLILVFVLILAQSIVYQQFVQLTEDGLRVIFESGSMRDLLFVCLAVFGIFTFRGILSFAVPRLSIWIAADAVRNLRRDLIGHVMSLDQAYFDATPPGTVILRLSGQAQGLSAFMGQGLVRAVRDVLTVLVLSTYLCWKQPVLFLSAAVVLPPIMLLMQLVTRRIRIAQRLEQDAMRDFITGLEETTGGMRTVKIAGQEGVERDRLTETTTRIRKFTIKGQTASALVLPFVDVAAAFVYMLVIGGGGYMVLSPAFDMDGAAIIAFLIGLVLVFEPARRLAQFWTTMQANLVILEQVRSVFLESPKIVDKPDARDDFDARGDIEFVSVDFSYEPDQPLFVDLDLTFEGGKTTAIVGPTGSGKTTILTLLGRLYEPQSGQITLGGLPIDQIRIAALRNAFSVVAQDIVVFNNSIWENIRYVRPDATDAEVRAAAEAAEIADLIDRRGDEPVGPKGAQLSGGQKQRIGIARAFLRDAPIVLLDEATSALDQATEEKVKVALRRLTARKTTIVVAHRLSSVVDADRIFLFDHGRVVESGTHEELIALDGLYASLFESQRQGYDGPLPQK